MRYPNELKDRVVLALKQKNHGDQLKTAKLLKVSPRTVRNWKQKQGQNKSPGRKKIGITFLEKIQITRQWRRQGFCGARPIIKALPDLRLRAVREVVAELKKRQKKRRNQRIKTNRQSIKINKIGIVQSIDGLLNHDGHDCILGKDRGSQRIKVQKCEQNFNANETIKFLSNLKDEKSLPLVLCSDNGSQICNKEVGDFLNTNYIIHLKNLPRVPQHNGACEIAVREFKDVFVENFDIEKTEKILNENRLRASLNYRTCDEFEKTQNHEISLKMRIEFFNKTTENIKMATSGISNAKIKRKVERSTILKTLEDFDLITITKGHHPASSKAEVIT